MTTSDVFADHQPGALEDAVLASCRQRDGWGLRLLLEQSHHQLGLERTITQVLLPALRHVGDQWASGQIDVGSEHLFSTTAERWLHSRLRPVAPGPRTPLALLSCGPGEDHVLALTALEILLSLRGWAVDNLGSSTPASSLRTAVRVGRPTAVVVVAHLPQTRSATVAALAGVAELVPAAQVYYAGGAFAAAADREGVAGSYLGADLVAAADRIAGGVSG